LASLNSRSSYMQIKKVCQVDYVVCLDFDLLDVTPNCKGPNRPETEPTLRMEQKDFLIDVTTLTKPFVEIKGPLEPQNRDSFTY
jgi:hypothetical protein